MNITLSSTRDCPTCKSHRVEKLPVEGFGHILRLALLRHYRCRECRATFWKSSQEAKEQLTQNAKRWIWILAGILILVALLYFSLPILTRPSQPQ